MEVTQWSNLALIGVSFKIIYSVAHTKLDNVLVWSTQ